MSKLKEPINKLKRIKAIQRRKASKEQFFPLYVVAPKPDGSCNFILNLKKFNKFV